MPADYTKFPEYLDLKVLLQNLGVYPTVSVQQARTDEQLTNIAAGVKREFERRTGKRPYLVTETDVTLHFDGTDFDGVLQPNVGIWSLTSASVNDTALVPYPSTGANLWLEPPEAQALGDDYKEPYTELHFATPVTNNRTRRSIALIGRFGWSLKVPPDVWVHCLRYGAALGLSQVENLENVASISQDGFSKGFDVVGVLQQKDLETIMQKRFDTCVQMNTRVV